MTIYLVEAGEKYEGGQVISVHKSETNAIREALNVECHFEGGWVRKDSVYYKNLCWFNGCDYVRVVEMEVLD